MSAEVSADIKLPKNSKENRYYYRHREEIIEKRLQKKMEDPEYKAKVEIRMVKKAEREALEQKRVLKREMRKQMIVQLLDPEGIPSGVVKSEKITPT